MEGLRKGSLFPFLETGRGEESGSRLPCIRRATRQEDSLPVSCASVFLSLRPFGEVTHPFPRCGLHRPVSLLLQILLASREQMGYLPLRAARCAMPESPVGPRPCVACRTGDSCRSCSGAALFLPMVRRSGARSFAYRPGCPGRTGAGMTRERPGKSGFSGREQKKHCLLLRLGIWTFDCVREVAAWGR